MADAMEHHGPDHIGNEIELESAFRHHMVAAGGIHEKARKGRGQYEESHKKWKDPHHDMGEDQTLSDVHYLSLAESIVLSFPLSYKSEIKSATILSFVYLLFIISSIFIKFPPVQYGYRFHSREDMMKTVRNHPYIALLVLTLFLYLTGNSLLAVTDTAESNYALTAKEMVLSGNWISPQIYGRYWYDKPIFYYWELALSFLLFGWNEMAARLPAALTGSLSVLFTFWFGRKVYGEKIGWLSALILSLSVECWLLSKAVITDSTLFLFMSASIAFFYLGYAEDRKYYFLCYAASALAALTKGPIGLLLPGLAALLFLIYKKDLREMAHVHLFSGLLLFAAITGAWYGTMWYLHGNDFILNFLGVHNFLRATVSEHPSHNKWYFYILIYFAGFAPWSFFIPFSLFKKWKRKEMDFKSAKDSTQLLAIYAFVIFLFFQLVATKYTTYTFPALFSLSLLTAILYKDRALSIEKAAVPLMVLYTVLVLAVAPTIMLSRSGKEIGQALAQMDTEGKTIAYLDNYKTSAVFYSGKKIIRAVPAERLPSMEPGTLSWNAKNVMPMMAEEDLLHDPHVILITDKEDSPFLKEYRDTLPASPIRIPGGFSLWVR